MGCLTVEQYKKLFSAYIYTNELCAAKFLWRRIPEAIKSDPELHNVWSVGHALWTKQYVQVYELIDYNWSDLLQPIMVAIKHRIQEDMLKLINVLFENLKLDKFQMLMGVDQEQAKTIVESIGWTCENGDVIPVTTSEPELSLNGSQEILDRLITVSSFTSYIEN